MQDNSKDKLTQLTKTFGILIKKHRMAQGKTIYRISAEAGMPKATWRELELGIKNFRCFLSFLLSIRNTIESNIGNG